MPCPRRFHPKGSPGHHAPVHDGPGCLDNWIPGAWVSDLDKPHVSADGGASKPSRARAFQSQGSDEPPEKDQNTLGIPVDGKELVVLHHTLLIIVET